MARTQGTSVRTQRLNALIAVCLLATATAIALGRVFTGTRATEKLLLVALASGLLACALERRNLSMATLVSAAAMLVAIGLLVFPETTLRGLPTMQTLHAIGDASRIVGEQARIRVAPTPPLQPLLLAALTATWAAIFSAHALAFRAGSPLLALVPPVALVAFADTVLDGTTRPLYGVVFLLAALALVFADGLRRVQGWGPLWAGPSKGARLSTIAGRGARRVAAAAVALSLIAPLWLPGFGSKAVFDFSHAAGNGINIDPFVSIGAMLTQNDREAFRVTTSQPQYWRMLALTYFSDDQGWGPATNPPLVTVTDGIVPQGDATAPLTSGSATSVDAHFQVSADLAMPWLPVPYPATSVQVSDDPLSYDTAGGALILGHGLDAGATYDTTSLLVQPKTEELQRVVLPTQDTVDTALPEDATTLAVRDLARQWTADAATPFDRVMAIQNRLRSSEFIYDESVNRADDSVTLLDFLTKTRRGFCEQFAAAMAYMLRSIGIPARVAVGFTAGQANPGTQTYTVHTKDAHSWVEVPFPGFGWLTFDPTPGRLDPATASYTNGAAVSCTQVEHHPSHCGPGGVGTTGGGQATAGASKSQGLTKVTDEERGTRKGGSGGSSSPTTTGGRWPNPRVIVGIGLLALLFVLALVAPARALRRRVRLRRARGDPHRLILATYDVFTERVGELGYPRGPGETLEEYRRRLTSAQLPVNGHLDRLTAIAAGAAYSPRRAGQADAREATDAARAAWGDLKRHTPLARRLLGAYRRS